MVKLHISMELEDYRKEIDEIDADILNLLGRRFMVVEKVSQHKKKNNIKIVQEDRMKEIYDKAEVIAHKKNLDPRFVHSLFELIINEAIRREK